jgi:hypothetical protein
LIDGASADAVPGEVAPPVSVVPEPVQAANESASSGATPQAIGHRVLVSRSAFLKRERNMSTTAPTSRGIARDVK